VHCQQKFMLTKINFYSCALSLCIFERTKAIPKAQRHTLARGLEECSLQLLFCVRAAGVASASAQKKNSCLQASEQQGKLRI